MTKTAWSGLMSPHCRDAWQVEPNSTRCWSICEKPRRVGCSPSTTSKPGAGRKDEARFRQALLQGARAARMAFAANQRQPPHLRAARLAVDSARPGPRQRRPAYRDTASLDVISGPYRRRPLIDHHRSEVDSISFRGSHGVGSCELGLDVSLFA